MFRKATLPAIVVYRARAPRFIPVPDSFLTILMKRIALLLVLVLGLAAASAARSQQPVGAAATKSKAQTDTVDFKASPELQKALADLAAAIQSLAQRIASDPEVKTAAMQVATGVVTTAQQVVAEQSVHIQDALKTAAERISAAQSQHDKAKKP